MTVNLSAVYTMRIGKNTTDGIKKCKHWTYRNKGDKEKNGSDKD